MLFITEVLCIDELKTKPLASSCHNCSFKYTPTIHVTTVRYQGRIQEGRTRHAPPPPKTGKNMIFWRKIVIFHTKYPNNFRSSLRNWKKIWIFGVKSWFFTRNTPKLFAPPSARRNFFKCAPPLTWNPGSAPGYMWGYA